MYRSILSLLALAATATAATIEIDVGEDGNLAFDPNSVTAAVGDVLEFHFYSGSGGHSVVESTFQSPCVPGSSTFFSGYIPGDDDGTTVFRVDVTSTDPIFFYCSLDHHCQAGMVGVVNPTSAESLAAYKQAAAGVSAGSAPSAPEGGTLVTIPAGSESSSSSAAVESSSSVASSHSSVASSSAGSSASVTSSSGSASSRASVASSASAASSHASSASSAASATSSHASSLLQLLRGLLLQRAKPLLLAPRPLLLPHQQL